MLPVLLLVFQLFQIARSSYVANREGLTINWGFQKMVIPIQEIEWIRPYDQMGYSIPLPFLGKIGIFSGRLFLENLGDILFFASSLKDAFLVGTTQEVLFLSPANPQAFEKGIQEAVYKGSITPLERKDIQIASPTREIHSHPQLYIPLGLSILFSVGLFILFGFTLNLKDSIQVGFVRFDPAAGVVLLPIISAVFTTLNTIFAPKMLKNQELSLYAFLLAYTGLFVSFAFILVILAGIIF